MVRAFNLAKWSPSSAGDAHALLEAERTALNFLQRLCGIATLDGEVRRRLEGPHHDPRYSQDHARLSRTGKIRRACGGGTNHRQRLDDGILIKDNHKRLAGGVGPATTRAMQASGICQSRSKSRNLDELDAVLQTGVPRILLDNFTTYDIREAVKRVNGRAEIEISGGVTLDRIPELADDRGAVCVDRRPHAFGACRGPELRARAGGMIPDELAAALTALRERRPDARFDVRWHASTPSTMDLAATLAHDGASHGVVVVADEQTAGRGRRGTSWASPPEAGLYLSFIARPRSIPVLSLITLTAGVGRARRHRAPRHQAVRRFSIGPTN
jgi:hypothetical protein